jgi:hypothetical protein
VSSFCKSLWRRLSEHSPVVQTDGGDGTGVFSWLLRYDTTRPYQAPTWALLLWPLVALAYCLAQLLAAVVGAKPYVMTDR